MSVTLSPLGLAALELAARGWRVFPVHGIVAGRCTCGDDACSHPGKHPHTGHGFKDASDDEAQIRAWWRQWRDANIGLPTGESAGAWVLDIDGEEGGESFERVRQRRAVIDGVRQTTGNGRQLFFAPPGEGLLVPSRTRIVPGIDLRGEGGYVIVPPSGHVSGRTYMWVEGSSLLDRAPSPAPPWLLELVLAEPLRQSARNRSCADVDPNPNVDWARVRSALDAIDPNVSHDTWLRIGMALHATGAGDAAFELWNEWSARATRLRRDGKGPVYPGTGALSRRWSSFSIRKDGITIATLFGLAAEGGWRRPPESGGADRGASDPTQRTVESPRDLEEALLAEDGVQRGREVEFDCPLPEHMFDGRRARYNSRKGLWYCDECRRGGAWASLARMRGLSVVDDEPSGEANDRPEIRYRTLGSDAPLHVIVPMGVEALAERCKDLVYVRDGRLVHVARGEDTSTEWLRRGSGPRIGALPDGVLREQLDRAAKWTAKKRSQSGGTYVVETWAPLPVVAATRERGEWAGIRLLLGIVQAPVLRPDGSVLSQPGYDPTTCLLYLPAAEYPAVPDAPATADVVDALATLVEPFREFRFETECDRMSLVALMLTIAGRAAIDGPVPHWAVMAPTFGAGKTLLVECAAIAMTGADPDLMSPVGGRPSDAEAEMRKRITAVLLETPRAVVIDNVPDGSTFESKAFASLLTARTWTDRLLGANERVSLPNHVVWASTGCNYRLWGDLARRSLSIVIDPRVEDPHLRMFAIEDLAAYVRDHHPRLLVSALTVLRGFVVAGQPRLTDTPLGKFEGWDRLVRGAVVWATGLSGDAIDPLWTAERLRDEAPDRGGLGDLLQAVARTFRGEAVTARQMVDAAISDEALRDAIVGVGATDRGEPHSRRLGNRLRVVANRVVGGMSFQQAGKSHGAVLWRVAAPGGGGPGESGDSGECGGGSPENAYARGCARAREEKQEGTRTRLPGVPRLPHDLFGSEAGNGAAKGKLGREAAEERAAILEYDAGLERGAAEQVAGTGESDGGAEPRCVQEPDGQGIGYVSDGGAP